MLRDKISWSEWAKALLNGRPHVCLSLAILHRPIKCLHLPLSLSLKASTEDTEPNQSSQLFGALSGGMDRQLAGTGPRSIGIEIGGQEVQKDVQILSLESILSQGVGHYGQLPPQGRTHVIRLGEVLASAHVLELCEERKEDLVRKHNALRRSLTATGATDTELPDEVDAAIGGFPGHALSRQSAVAAADAPGTVLPALAQLGRQGSARVQLAVGVGVNVVLPALVLLPRHGWLLPRGGQIRLHHPQHFVEHGLAVRHDRVAEGDGRVLPHAPNLIGELLRPPLEQRLEVRLAFLGVGPHEGAAGQAGLVADRPALVVEAHEQSLQEHGHVRGEVLGAGGVRSDFVRQFGYGLAGRLPHGVVVGVGHLDVVPADDTGILGHAAQPLAGRATKDQPPRLVAVQLHPLGQVEAVEAHPGEQDGVQRGGGFLQVHSRGQRILQQGQPKGAVEDAPGHTHLGPVVGQRRLEDVDDDDAEGPSWKHMSSPCRSMGTYGARYSAQVGCDPILCANSAMAWQDASRTAWLSASAILM